MAFPEAGFNSSGLQGVFDFVLNTDSIKKCKPDQVAYQLGVEVLNLKRKRIFLLDLVAGINQVQNILAIQ